MQKSQYELIPLKCVGKNILEIGAGKQPILKSKLKNHIYQSQYLGIDINPVKGSYYVLQGDIIDYPIDQETYDTIIMIEVLEHIHLKHWDSIVTKLKQGLKKGGYLIISTPYNEKLSDFIFSPTVWKTPSQIHTVFGIRPKVMKKYFPNCQIIFSYKLLFRQDNASFKWAIMRFIKRLVRGPFPLRRSMIVIWKKST